MKLKLYSLQIKILALTFISMVPLLASVEFFLMPMIYAKLMSDRQDSTRYAVELAIQSVDQWQKMVEQKKISNEEAQMAAIADIRHFRYNKSEYFWIQNESAKIIMHPIKPELEGKDLSGLQDKNGKYIFKEFAEAVKNSDRSGSVDYLWPKPGQETPAPKISFIKQSAGWGWIIGSGVYVDDVQKEIQMIRFKIWSFFLAISLVSLGLSYKLASGISRKLNDVSNRLQKVGLEVGSAVHQLVDVGQGLSASSTETAVSLEETVASLDEITSMIQNNSRSADEAADLSAKSRQLVEKGEVEITDLVQSMSHISLASKKIEQIIEVIDDISFQTNLLSLNAAVEAARAGEQGKGFAVVADAVRTLALKSADAAKDISGLINETVRKIEHGSKVAQASGGVLADITNSINRVAQINSEIALASREQASGIGQINSAMSQIDQTSQNNAASAEKLSVTSNEVNNLAQTTKNITFELEVIVRGDRKEAA